ncbi:MAG: PAS domain S-box protein [Verrucomicrobia bacterium]|nr:PAS domain S-box protein [Verrucomicrobiota bacterium]
MGWDACLVGLCDPQQELWELVLRMDTINGEKVTVPWGAAGRPGPLMRQVILEGPRLILRGQPDEADSGLIPFGSETRRSASLMFAPMPIGERVVGIVSIQSYTRHAYTQNDLTTLQALADHCGGALNRIQAGEALAQHAGLAALGANVGMALTRSGSLQEVLRHCAEALVKHLDAAFARVWTLNEAEQVLELQASAGIYTHLDGSHGRVPVGQFKIGLIAQERKPHLTNSVIGDPRVNDQEWARREGMVAFAGYPLLVEDRVIGVMALFARHPLSDTTLTALGSVADAIAVGIERKRAEEALRENERRFRATFEQAAVGMSHVLPEGRFKRVNQKFCDITGYSRDELLARTIQDITHPDDLQADLKQVRRLLAGEIQTYSMEKRYIRQDGSQVWVELTVSLVRKSGGEADYFIAVIEDITNRRSLEMQLRQSQKMEAVGQLAGGVAHDFNNILAAMMMQTELADLVEATPPEVRETLRDIRAAAERAANLTRQLLLFSRRQVMQPRLLDLNEVVTGLAKMLQRIIREDVRLQLHLHSAPLMIYADAGMLDQLLMNLAVNARDAMPNGGRLLIETAEKTFAEEQVRLNPEATPGRYAWLSVSDTGCGISHEVLPRIFEPFFTTKEAGQGTGLGLATVFGIVKQHRGWIKVYSEPGQGTNFQVFLPTSDASPEELADEAVQLKPHGGTETVLVVEDDAAVRMLTRVTLERQGYRVLEAANGVEAHEVWQRHRGEIALLLTDLVMPGSLSGRELARQLQVDRPELKVIFTSGYSLEIAGQELKLKAGQNFVQKPCPPYQLLDTIRHILES